jgi:Carboxypeptidase regulatory-like domain
MPTKSFAALGLSVAMGRALALFALPPAGNGAITGKVTYTGTPPKMRPIDMSQEPWCAKQHVRPVLTQNVATGPDNTLRSVLVYISAGDEGTRTPLQGVRYDQTGCQYFPHILPMLVGQELQIFNDDSISHHIPPVAKMNQEWNKPQPPGSPPIVTKWDKPEFIPVKCDIHPWMHGYLVVLKTSHYAVTGEDGTFSITGLPPGKYTVTAWQEQYRSKSQDVIIAGSETRTANFVFAAAPH